jgi:hypothetical protein
MRQSMRFGSNLFQSRTSVESPDVAHPSPLGWTALVVFPLLLGGAIYLGFRTEQLLMFGAAEHLGMGDTVRRYRHAVAPLRESLPDWVVFSLPNALWTFSMLCFFAVLWRTHRVFLATWTGIAVTFSAGAELLQAAALVPGTFSVADLVATVVACLAAAAILAPSLHLHQKQQSCDPSAPAP